MSPPNYTSDVAFSAAVKRVQIQRGSRPSYARMEASRGGFAAAISPEIAAYIAERDSFYLATASAAGQPYVQHRGGPPGFLHVLDAQTLAFADFAGNKQYVSTGNLAENDRAFLFLMDYETQTRVKIWGRAKIVFGDAALNQRLATPAYDAKIEQAIVFDVSAWDVNCQQHIPRLVRAADADRRIAALQDRVRDLEALLTAAQNSRRAD